MLIKLTYLHFVIIAAFFSGYFIETDVSNRGIVVLTQIAVGIIAMLYFITNFKYSRRWLALCITLFLLLILNGSGYGSVALISLNLVLVEIFRKSLININIDRFFNYKFLFMSIYFLLLVAFIDFLYGFQYLWSHDSKFLFINRLKLFTSEPSYLAMLIVPLIFITNSIKNKIAMHSILLLTQSYLGYVFLGVIYFLSKKSNYVFIYIAGISIFLYLLTIDFRDFFSNSGFVRLVGVTLFTNGDVNIVGLLLGNGVGAGDDILQPSFSKLGIDQTNGFIFSALYDMGLIGLFLFVYILGSNKFEYLVTLFLLLNFGAGNFLLVVILFLSKIVYYKSNFLASYSNKNAH